MGLSRLDYIAAVHAQCVSELGDAAVVVLWIVACVAAHREAAIRVKAVVVAAQRGEINHIAREQ